MKLVWALSLATSLTACDWVALAYHAATYETLGAEAAENVALSATHGYVTLAKRGIVVIDLAAPARRDTLPVPAGMESVDDLAVAGNLLFLLDARPPGHLAVLSLADPGRPVLVDAPRAIPVGPFSGVSARDGWLIVSGGTSSLTAFRYVSSGKLDGAATLDLGRGQPDVLVARGGAQAFVSTHYWGPHFGVDVVTRDRRGDALLSPGRLPLPHAGFTAGGAKPATFPIEVAQVSDSIVLVAHGRGVAVVDVANAERPTLARVVDVGGSAVNVDVRGTTAAVAVASPRPAIVLLELAAGDAAIIARIALPQGTIPAGVALAERQVVVAARERGILVLNR